MAAPNLMLPQYLRQKGRWIMATDSDWSNTTNNMRWSLGPQSDQGGRQEMQDGLLAGDVNRMGEVKDGFYRTQNKRDVRDSFDACAHDNQGRLYNIGRSILGLPGV
jgi:hypothetical protein